MFELGLVIAKAILVLIEIALLIYEILKHL